MAESESTDISKLVDGTMTIGAENLVELNQTTLDFQLLDSLIADWVDKNYPFVFK